VVNMSEGIARTRILRTGDRSISKDLHFLVEKLPNLTIEGRREL
jgi:hypothetical protein